MAATEAVLPGEDAVDLGVTLPLTQPLPSLVVLDAGVITTTQTVEGADEPTIVELPVQGAFTIPVWLANGNHKHPLAVILPERGPRLRGQRGRGMALSG